MGYVCLKISVWEKYEIDDEDVDKFLEITDEETRKDFLSEAMYFSDPETLYDTVEELSPSMNGGFSTVEVYKGEFELVYENGKSSE